MRGWQKSKGKSMHAICHFNDLEGRRSDYGYFCMINLKGIDRMNKYHVQYPDVRSAIQPIPHSSDPPVLEPRGYLEYSSDSKRCDMTIVAGDDAYKPKQEEQPVPFAQVVLNDLMLYFDLRPGPKILFLGNTPEGSDTFQQPVIERDCVGGLRLMIWENVKVPFCHYSHAPE